MTTLQEVLKLARSRLKRGDRVTGAKLLVKAGDTLSSHSRFKKAAKIYEEAAEAYREAYLADECFTALDKATLMLIRAGQDAKTRQEIVRINTRAGDIAEEATEHRKAAEYFFRAADFAGDPHQRMRLNVRAADALENEADVREEQGDFAETLKLLTKVGRIYYASGDEELGRRIYQRAIRIAKKWAQQAKEKGDYASAGNALAQAAQLLQDQGNLAEAPRLLMEAGELYEKAGLFEKAGNTYDAAQEIYRLERLTAARRKAMIKASEAYMQMKGKPEVVAPLLIKAGNMFREVNSPIKAKWAFKRAGEIFHELAERAVSDGDIDSYVKYLRYQAMCLKNWGALDEAEDLYNKVVNYYEDEASKREKEGNLEFQAIRLEELADVLYEMGQTERANAALERALEIYVEIAETATEAEDLEESSRFYSRAAECALKMNDLERCSSFHWVASEKAQIVAENYEKSGVKELATIWKRTSALEALKTKRPAMKEKAIKLLRESANGFREIGELKEAFEDLFLILTVLSEEKPEEEDQFGALLDELQEIALSTGDERMQLVLTVLRPLQLRNHFAAILRLQEHEDELGDKVSMLRRIIEAKKRAIENSQ